MFELHLLSPALHKACKASLLPPNEAQVTATSLFNQSHFQIQADMAQLLYVHLYALLYWLM